MGRLKALQWPPAAERSAFDPPVAAVLKAARRTPHLRVVPPVPAEPEPVAAAPVAAPAAPAPVAVPAALVPAPASPALASPAAASPAPAAHQVDDADRAEISLADPEVEPLDLADGRETIAHYAHLLKYVEQVEGFTRSQLRNTTYVQRFEPAILEVALSAVVDADQEEIAAALRDAAGRILERVPAVKLIACGPDSDLLTGETVYEWEQRLATEARRAREEAARRDPAIRAAVSILQAEIWNVRAE
ncbi:MAG: hypothetical protein R3F43_16335 [bacterium]